VLFFTMLLALGLGSQIGMLEGMLCTIFDIDIFKRVRKPILTGFVCGFCFLVGLIFCTGKLSLVTPNYAVACQRFPSFFFFLRSLLSSSSSVCQQVLANIGSKCLIRLRARSDLLWWRSWR
jgi:SNF family Na+-dependent transporter